MADRLPAQRRGSVSWPLDVARGLEPPSSLETAECDSMNLPAGGEGV